MNRTKIQVLCATVALAAAAMVGPAFAGECPAGSVGVDVTPPGPMMPSGVTDDVISSIDLGQGYNVPGRLFRMRKLVVQRGGIVPWHAHNERPANIYIVSGEITEYRSTCAVPITHRAGDVVAETGATSHWWKNNSRKPAVLISADILPPAMDAKASM